MSLSEQYFRMELLHAEKLRKQQKELEQAEMDLVSTHTHLLSFFFCTGSLIVLFTLQGGYEFSPEIMSGKLAELVYRDATGKIQGELYSIALYLFYAICIA